MIIPDLTHLIASADPADLPDLLGELERAKAAAWVRLTAPPESPVRDPADRDPRLTPDDVVARLGVTKRWVYRHAVELGGRKLSRRRLRFTEAGVRRYLARRDP